MTNEFHTPQPPDDSHWIRSPMTTRHSQATLLLVSFTWGLSYCMPPAQRIPFSEVFPFDLTRWSSVPMWGWGAALLFFAAVAFMGERIILERGPGSATGWRASFMAHTFLVGIYGTLAVAALAQGISEIQVAHSPAVGLISALSRPVLWSYIAYLHLTYARLPRPASAFKQKKHRRLRFIVREEVEE